VFRYNFPPKKRARFSSVCNITKQRTKREDTTSIKHHVRRRSLHRRFQILRPAYRRPAIRPIFQRHHRSQREWKIQHFGFHLLRVRDYQFESGKTHIRLTLTALERENVTALVVLCALLVFLTFTRVHFDAAGAVLGFSSGRFLISFLFVPLSKV